MKAVITGSNGFIGKALVKELLNQHYEVCVLVRFINGSLNMSVKSMLYENSLKECTKELTSWQPDVFFHLAWQGVDSKQRNKNENFSYNYQLTIDSLELAIASGCKQWIGAGSQAEYGVLNKLISEDDVCAPVTSYGIAKQQLYHETKHLCDLNHLTHTWARIFSVYGPTDHNETFISYLTNNMLHQKVVEVSSCLQQWDYLFIDDAASALYSLIHHGGLYNIASGKTVVLKDVVEILAHLTTYKESIKWGLKQDTDLHYLCGSIQKIKKETGWVPKINLNEGLAATIAQHNSKRHESI